MHDTQLLKSTLIKVLPYYYRYFKLTGQQAPSLDPRIDRVVKNAIPAILDQGFWHLPLTDESQELTK